MRPVFMIREFFAMTPGAKRRSHKNGRCGH